MPSAVIFVSLGALVLDEIHKPGRTASDDNIGGSLAYGTLGARLYSSDSPERVGMILKIGNDFPKTAIEILKTWNMSLNVVTLENEPSTRGLLHYASDMSTKTFRYITPPLVVSPTDVGATPLIGSSAFHFFETPEGIEEKVPLLLSMRKQFLSEDRTLERPLIVWEPKAKSCFPGNLSACLKAARHVDLFSPNELEMASLFESATSTGCNPSTTERYAATFLEAGVGHSSDGSIVIRAAERGCLVASRSIGSVWLPAFYSGKTEKVIDTTGGGNAFLGGFIVGWHENKSVVDAATYGNVAASFALEQVGLPTLVGQGEGEICNGVNVRDRLRQYQKAVPKV